MATREQIETIANACLEANQEIKQYGTPEMQILMRVLLLHVGQELGHELLQEHKIMRDAWVERPEHDVQAR